MVFFPEDFPWKNKSLKQMLGPKFLKVRWPAAPQAFRSISKYKNGKCQLVAKESGKHSSRHTSSHAIMLCSVRYW